MTGFDLSRRAHKCEVPTPAATFADTMSALAYLDALLAHRMTVLSEGAGILIQALTGIEQRPRPR